MTDDDQFWLWVFAIALLVGSALLVVALPGVAWWRVLAGSVGFVLLLVAGVAVHVHYSAAFLSRGMATYFQALDTSITSAIAKDRQPPHGEG